MSDDTVKQKCLRAFENGEKEEATRLLFVVVSPRTLKYYEQRTILFYACYYGWIDIVMELINEYQLDPKCRDSNGDTTLHTACRRKGNLHIIQYLINECRCDPMSKNNYGNTPLHNACESGDIEVVQFLIVECRCDPMNKNNYGNTPLHRACESGDIEMVRYMIGECRCDLMSENNDGNTPLHSACYQKGNLHIIQYLINECRCDPMSKNNDGDTPLHSACESGDIEMVRYMIGECRCDPMSKNYYGNTPLHRACESGDIEMVRYMIGECRCDLMSENNDGNTPLHSACYQKGNLHIIQYLINECRCDLMSKNNDGDTPLHSACESGDIEMVRYMIGECRCDPMSKNNYGNTPLHRACESGDIEMVRYMIGECRCDLMSENNRGNTTLHSACYRKGNLHIIQYLINECRCDLMSKNRFDNTPLHIACQYGDIEMVQFLISECRCDPMCKNKVGNTLLHKACYFRNIPVVEYILSTGKIDPLVRNIHGETPLMITDSQQRKDLKKVFAKFGKIKMSHPVNSYVNVVLLGNPGAGKSTLAQVIIQRASGVFASIRGLFQYVKGVELCTAGIIPSKLEHRELGNVILHDLAGHPEYYSSHIAVLENLLHGSAAVFIIVVSLSDLQVCKHLHHWLSIVENECHKALCQCHVITVASHIDEVNQRNLPNIYREVAEISSSRLSQQSIVNCGLVHLDCRKIVGGELSSFTTTLSSACQSIRSTNTREMSLYCHMLYALLEEREESVYTLDQLMAILRESEEYCLPQVTEEITELLSSLHTTGLIVFLKNNRAPSNSWVVARKEVLLTKVNGVVFAPDNFKEHCDIASNTGIISLSSLSQLFPQYSSDMLVVFLQYMELCQEISQEFLAFTNLMTKEEESSDEMKRLLFFPALIRDTERPQEIRETFQFGWCLQCSNPHQYFVPRFLHVLLLHLAYNYALPKSESSIPNLHRLCDIWKNGIHWLDTRGVESVVELVDNSQCVILLMSCKQGLEHNMIERRKEVISEILSLRKLICCRLEVEEFVIDPDDLEYPIIKPSERTLYNMKLISSCIIHQEPCVLDSKGHKHRLVQELLPFEPSDNIYSSGGRRVSVFAGRDPEVSYSSSM